jgi:hypothetical protein
MMRRAAGIALVSIVAFLAAILSGCETGSVPDEPAATIDATEREAYVSKLVLSKVMAKPATDSSGDRLAIVSGEIKNTGERTLRRVQVMIYFLDKDGRRVHEEASHPVLSGGSFGSATPLRANYTREFSGGFKVPSEWAGEVNLKVTEIEFERSPTRGVDSR